MRLWSIALDQSVTFEISSLSQVFYSRGDASRPNKVRGSSLIVRPARAARPRREHPSTERE